MNTANRRLILRANAAFLGIASLGAFILLDLRGIVLGSGPVAQVLAAAPHAAVGFVEAHGLAFIIAVLMWKAKPVRFVHLTAAAVMGLLGVCNIAFWPIFTVTGMTAAGIVATSLHLLFATAHLLAATRTAVEA